MRASLSRQRSVTRTTRARLVFLTTQTRVLVTAVPDSSADATDVNDRQDSRARVSTAARRDMVSRSSAGPVGSSARRLAAGRELHDLDHVADRAVGERPRRAPHVVVVLDAVPGATQRG